MKHRKEHKKHAGHKRHHKGGKKHGLKLIGSKVHEHKRGHKK